ncbi:MAG: hypothetical protein KDB72_07540 [Mycobacterium sp.]|nr:hypothetical protein [Mycobacterium sp.]
MNWILALSTVLGAAVAELFAIGAVMGTATCSTPNCPKPTGLVYGLLTYAPLVIAVATIVVTIFTAGHRRGYLVPLVAWALIIIDVGLLTATFN